MKKIITVILTVCMLISVFVPVNADNTGASPESGVSISAENYYKTEEVIDSVPLTYEATVYIPSGTVFPASKAAPLIGNYRDIGITVYITKWNNPRITFSYYNKNGAKEEQIETFTKVALANDKWEHFAIVYNPDDNSLKCYVNGTLRQTLTLTPNTADGTYCYDITEPFFVGKDHRTAYGYGKDDFFPAKIGSITFYSDVRTASEVAADVTAPDLNDENIIFSYNFDGRYNKRVEDNGPNNYDLWCPLVPETYRKEGVETNLFNYYEMEDTLAALPLTYEATIYIPSDVTLPSEGAIIGNYRDIGATVFINNWKNPRITYSYYNKNGKREEKIETFTKIGLATDKWIHLAIVYNPTDNTLACYVDGVLKQTLTVVPNTADGTYVYAPESAMLVGKDKRREYNFEKEAFFPGKIRTITLFSDVRTAEEIAVDKESVDVNADGIIAHYNFDGADLANVRDKTANGNDLKFAARYVEENTGLKDYAYSFAILGDTQNLNERHPNNFPRIFDYILDNAESKKIAHVFAVGDITNSNTETEWQLASEQYARLNGVVDYSITRGNHDGPQSAANFNKYFGEGTVHAAQYEGVYTGNGDGICNTWRTFTVGDIDYLVINIDYGTTDDVLLWAEEIVKTHPNHNVIINTHAYLTTDGTTLDDDDKGSPTTHGTYTNNGQTYWEKLVSKYSNIVMVLSGHIDSEYIVMNQSKGENGNTVSSFLINSQGMDYQAPGVGMVAMFYFSADGRNVQVEYYSTVNEGYWLKENFYTFTLDKVDPRYGDVNDDAQVNVLDLIRLKKVLAKVEVKYNGRTADCNIDKSVDVYDLTALRKKILGI